MLAFSNDYYGMIFRATQSVELFCAYDHVATERILEMFRPLLIKNSLINGRFDEDLYQELRIEVLRCIKKYKELE